MIRGVLILLLAALSAGAQVLDGQYRATLRLHDNPVIELPFNFSLDKQGRKRALTIRNADERITVKDIKTKADSLFFKLPVFDTEVRVKCSGDTWSGFFVNHYRANERIIPFKASRNEVRRFLNETPSSHNIEGRWRARFSPTSADSSDAVGIFHHIEQTDLISATFLTETGDYRYLEGKLAGDSLYLSAFDGSHAFLFLAKINGDSIHSGMFYSGAHWQEPWLAVRNSGFSLRDADKITFLKDSSETINFTFKNVKGKSVSLSDKRFQKKPVIVQLMGSWCPNCMDESRYLSELYGKYRHKGLEIVALAFEKSSDEKKVRKQLSKLKTDLSIPYEILITGAVGKDEAGKTMRMLNAVHAFPTTIFLNRDHKAVKAHTGFSGPATGKEFDRFKKETEAFVERLLK